MSLEESLAGLGQTEIHPKLFITLESSNDDDLLSSSSSDYFCASFSVHTISTISSNSLSVPFSTYGSPFINSLSHPTSFLHSAKLGYRVQVVQVQQPVLHQHNGISEAAEKGWITFAIRLSKLHLLLQKALSHN